MGADEQSVRASELEAQITNLESKISRVNKRFATVNTVFWINFIFWILGVFFSVFLIGVPVAFFSTVVLCATFPWRYSLSERRVILNRERSKLLRELAEVEGG